MIQGTTEGKAKEGWKWQIPEKGGRGVWRLGMRDTEDERERG